MEKEKYLRSLARILVCTPHDENVLVYSNGDDVITVAFKCPAEEKAERRLAQSIGDILATGMVGLGQRSLPIVESAMTNGHWGKDDWSCGGSCPTCPILNMPVLDGFTLIDGFSKDALTMPPTFNYVNLDRSKS